MKKKFTSKNNLNRRTALITFVLIFAVVGSYLVYSSFAAIPTVKTDAEYWRPRIASCESGGRYNAVNSAGYYGAYQFSLSTWRGAIGPQLADQYPNPIDAPPAIQDQAFNNLFSRRGTQPWNSSYYCWSRGTAIVTPKPKAPVFIPKLNTYNITVSGNVSLAGAPVKDAKIDTCGNSGEDFKTDAAGNFAFIMSSGKDFCVRVKDNPAVRAINNTFDNRAETTYEYQKSATSCYKDIWCLFTPAYRWDRDTDAGYDFIG